MWMRGQARTKYAVVAHKRVWVVPALSGRSLLFAAGTWRKSVIYAMCRNTGCAHREAARMARSRGTRLAR
jgi:hypothetical protein